MNNFVLIKQYRQIKKLIDETQKSTHSDLELQGHWGKYLCILVSGFFENSISEIYGDFVSSCASSHVSQYARRSLEKVQNPKAKRFVETALQFRKEWGEELQDFLNQDPSRKNAIDSIMNNRHLIAHGKTSGISVHQVRDYLEKGVEVITFIERQCSNSQK